MNEFLLAIYHYHAIFHFRLYRTVTQFFGVFGCFSLLFFCIRTPFHKSIPVFNSYITGVSFFSALGL